MNEITLKSYLCLNSFISEKVNQWKEAKVSGLVVFVICMITLAIIGIAYGAYCTYKGMNFNYAFKLNPWTFEIGCTR